MKCIVLSIIVCGAAVIARAETKVGIIGLDTSHAIAFTKIMNVTKDPAVAGFRVTYAYQWGSKDIASATNRYPKYIAQMKEIASPSWPAVATGAGVAGTLGRGAGLGWRRRAT